eukprot:TRINITY_DN773_c1_g1_i1.p1 TRINITY_DN773_c1_g1~~TRINITY_DN773_c1_g1_i1.p1  ORF type:complete len:305 (+),score=139.15 TRINITY_DN773_c1_g1_i1:91-1005(+)
MLLVIRTLTGKEYRIEMKETETTLNVKTLLSNHLKIPIESQFLILKGLILANETPLNQLFLSPEDFAVLVVVKNYNSENFVKFLEQISLNGILNSDLNFVRNFMQTTEQFNFLRKSNEIMIDESGSNIYDNLESYNANSISIGEQQQLVSRLLSAIGGMYENSEGVTDPESIEVDPVAVEQLAEMGFGRERVQKALILSRMNREVATEWLIEHVDDPDADAPISPEQFETLSATEIQEIAEETGPVVQSILANPTVQTGLTNPRVRGILAMIIATPSSLSQYMEDVDVSPVLSEALRILRDGDF